MRARAEAARYEHCMTDAGVQSWLRKQTEQTDPAQTGLEAAVQLAQSIAALATGEGMAFGLVISGEDTADLAKFAQARLQGWIDAGGTQRYRDLVERLGAEEDLRKAGIASPSPAPSAARLIVWLPADPPASDFEGAEAPEAWNQLRDSPCFDDIEWIEDANLVLTVRNAKPTAELTLMCTSVPDEATAAQLLDSLWELGAGEILFINARDEELLADVAFDDVVGFVLRSP